MKALLAIVALGSLVSGFQDKAQKRDLKDRIEVQGTIVCVGCALEKDSGADAQCTLHSKHAQGLRGSDGLLYTFLDNAKGHMVMTNAKLRDKEVKVLGWKYPKSQPSNSRSTSSRKATNGSHTTTARPAASRRATTRISISATTARSSPGKACRRWLCRGC